VSALVSFLHSRAVGTTTTITAAVVVTAVLLAAVLILVPGSPDTIAADVPASVVWNFRLASLGQLAVLWTAMGLAGGLLLDRLTRTPVPTH
jgi:predicted cobalt transporter CbtA